MPEVVAVANGRPIWMWTEGVPVGAAAREQLLNTARLPFRCV